MALPIPKLTAKQFLQNERTAEYKSEYYRGETFAMAGGSPRHARLAMRVSRPIMNRLDGRDCDAYSSDLMVLTGTDGLYTYPDVTIVCGPLVTAPDEPDLVMNPKVIVEVLSNATRRIDLGEKKDAYLTIPSLSAYLLIEPDSAAIVVHRRTEQGFVREVYEGMERVVPLPEIEAELPLAEVFEAVQFSPERRSEEDGLH